MDLSIVIPAYNEASCLENSVTSIQGYLAMYHSDLSTEIILVIEPSFDETKNIALSLSESYSNIRIILNEKRLGKGFSVKRGMLAAEGRNVFFMDADLSTPLTNIAEFLPLLEIFDIVIASRHCKGGSIDVPTSSIRRFLTKAFNFICHHFFSLKYKDTQCGFKAFRRDTIYPLFANLKTPGFTFDLELLYYANLCNFRVKEKGVAWIRADHSSYNPVTDTLIGLNELRLFYRFLRSFPKEEVLCLKTFVQ